MTEETLKHELYKHGSYLHSLKESGSEFVNIDDEIKKNEELFQLASKKDHQQELNIKNNNDNSTPWSQIMSDHQPAFAVGEYYASKTGILYKVVTMQGKALGIKSLIDFELIDSALDATALVAKHSTPATAEQIATFQRAAIKNDIDFIIKDGNGDWIEIVENIQDYLQTAEELQEVEDNE